MTAVVAMYTICSLNDKYAVSKAKLNGSQLTFLMAAGTISLRYCCHFPKGRSHFHFQRLFL